MVWGLAWTARLFLEGFMGAFCTGLELTLILKNYSDWCWIEVWTGSEPCIIECVWFILVGLESKKNPTSCTGFLCFPLSPYSSSIALLFYYILFFSPWGNSLTLHSGFYSVLFALSQRIKDRISNSHIPGQTQIYFVGEDNFILLLTLPTHPKCPN